MKYWVAEGLVEAGRATVSVLDHGFTVADGVFETLKVVDGVPFALTRHLRRLAASASLLGLPEPDPVLVANAARSVCGANAAELGTLGRLRITYTAGAGPLGSERGDAVPTLVAAVSSARPWPASEAVATVPWPRNERSPLAGCKSTSYAENVVALAGARAAGASEALLPNTRGELCEGTGSNVFVAVAGELLTPPLASGCLGGITRELFLEWADGILPVREAVLPMSVLETADEVFLTSSTRDVHPVHRVDGRALAAPGPLTAAAARLFGGRAADDVDP